jgi:hypothetical protein
VKQDVNLDGGITLGLNVPVSVDVDSMGANIAAETFPFVNHPIPICPRKMYGGVQAKPDLSPALQRFAPAQSKPRGMTVIRVHRNDQKFPSA